MGENEEYRVGENDKHGRRSRMDKNSLGRGAVGTG